MHPLELDKAPVAVDEDGLSEPLVGMFLKNAPEDLGFGRLRRGCQRRVELRGEESGAHVDLARGGPERQIALEPQMLERQCDNADDREEHADRGRRWGQAPPDRRAGGTLMRAFKRLDRAASPSKG